ncbi:23S rRNA (-2'-O)-methyltransferase [Exophiala aquamarina CBS 119918]|uniref:Putative tRNA (cytidine(32)/guanosine(34)-2'-O)-methyltransferase n=1 Tax=Exophiala aquamarina CBS 119918 TaxID=1182545 RepID=A0A072P478_9EURO|nr:23S rRNA (-2'-O)-methyltransferase [Exophiala aquamarina CBS 119918]KEF54512.1 23S rRNA (-2'-O)-methyltransferase [Exophiala aquamarina CBS 119918]
MGKSSKDKRDAYYRLAKEQNWRARSAFKLIQIDEQFDLFSYSDTSKCTRVVDLCAAPGSWSQVLSRVLIKGESFGRRAWVEKMERLKSQNPVLRDSNPTDATLTDGIGSIDINNTKPTLKPRENVKIVAIDLQPMAPLEGIIQLKADITHPSTVPLLLKAIDPDFDEQNETHRVDLVISDGAPDVTGMHDLDIYVQSQLLYSALVLAMKVLKPGGKFVAKIFRGRDVDLIYAQLRLVFERVHVAKPRSSRASSIEAFVVCEGYKHIKNWTPEIGSVLQTPVPTPSNSSEIERPVQGTGRQTRHPREDGVVVVHFEDEETDPKRWIAPFLSCGDLSAWDADATYKLPAGHTSLPPVQPPTAPPYKEAIERKRAEGGAYGKTKDPSRIVIKP